jgi:MSHA biogenesis protein MshK
MAEFMKEPMMRMVIGACLLLAVCSVRAQLVPDPTRPPDALNPALASAGSAQHAGPVLQSVLVSNGRKVAIVDGREVRLNDRFGDARVVKITETEVVLRSGRHVQTLKLFPDVEKRGNRDAGRKKTDKRQREKVQ